MESLTMLDALSIVLVMSTILKPCPNTAQMESSLMAREPFYRFTLCLIRCSKKSALKTTLTSFSDSMFIAINRYPFFWNSLQLTYFQFNAKFTPAEFPLMRHFKERVYLGVETITKLDFQEWLKSWLYKNIQILYWNNTDLNKYIFTQACWATPDADPAR